MQHSEYAPQRADGSALGLRAHARGGETMPKPIPPTRTTTNYLPIHPLHPHLVGDNPSNQSVSVVSRRGGRLSLRVPCRACVPWARSALHADCLRPACLPISPPVCLDATGLQCAGLVAASHPNCQGSPPSPRDRIQAALDGGLSANHNWWGPVPTRRGKWTGNIWGHGGQIHDMALGPACQRLLLEANVPTPLFPSVVHRTCRAPGGWPCLSGTSDQLFGAGVQRCCS